MRTETLASLVTMRSAEQLFGADSDMDILEVVTPHCRALISLQGAQVLSFVPVGQKELLWLSPRAVYKEGEAIRGGIPICLPWFGVNRRQEGALKHGFARLQNWQYNGVLADSSESLTIGFSLCSKTADLALFPWPFSAELHIEFSHCLTLRLTVNNLAGEALPLSFAFHSYFAVTDLAQAEVLGLEEREYLDNCLELVRSQQQSPLVFNQAVDRVYPASPQPQRIRTGGQDVVVEGDGCDTVIVWNPGLQGAEKMADVAGCHSEFVCVERGMAFDDELNLAPGERHSCELRLGYIGD
ncbi:MAG: D-hexose-6-phosphate mutarotase [Spongiibacteraceae bacterium]